MRDDMLSSVDAAVWIAGLCVIISREATMGTKAADGTWKKRPEKNKWLSGLKTPDGIARARKAIELTVESMLDPTFNLKTTWAQVAQDNWNNIEVVNGQARLAFARH